MSNKYPPVLPLTALLLGVLLSACSRPAPPALVPAAVVALPVFADRTPADGMAWFPIEVVPRYQNTLSFRVGGKLIERRVRLGDHVRAGQILARLDAADAAAEAAAARAALEAAEHRLLFAGQQLERDRAQAAEALIAANALEQTEDNYRAARGARDQAAAQLTVAGHNVQYQRLIADHDGAITSEYADTGQNVAAGQAVYGIAWSGDVDVVLDAAPSDLPRIAVGGAAIVTFTALPGTRVAARVREIAPAADAASRSYRVKLGLVSAGTPVRLGMTGEARLAPPAATPGVAAGPPLYKVPATAIFHQGATTAVWVIRTADSTLELRPVAVRRYTTDAAYLESGLHDGESVVQAGVHTVFAGQHVNAVKPLFADEAEAAAAGSNR